MSQSPFLTTAEVAERYRVSVRTIHERTRLGLIPHWRHAGERRCLFREDWLRRYEEGCLLELVELPQGGRVVRPVTCA